MIKKTISIFVVLSIVSCFLIACASATDGNTPGSASASTDMMPLSELAELSGKEIIAELEKDGEKLPVVYEDAETQEEAVKTIIMSLNEGNLPDDAYPYNYTGLIELTEAIKEKLNL